MIFSQIFDILDVGIVILDQELKVFKWNRWMELHSEIPADKIVGQPLFAFFPHLDNPKFLRSCTYALSLGNLYYFSQKLHKYLFPFKPVSALDSRFEYMQQWCNMGPLRDEHNVIKHLYITVKDVTEIAIYEQKLIDMNMQDGLTVVFNRRFLEFRLKEEIDRYKRYQKSFSVVMLDLDHFKTVNDNYGHLYGDFVLRALAELIRANLRSTDLVSRYGGEEFCCILPETNIDQALVIAERCRTTVEDQMFEHQEVSAKITISIGVAEMTSHITSPAVLIEKADQALYEAKRGGRNRIVAAG
jgi:diguanylate cyclase